MIRHPLVQLGLIALILLIIFRWADIRRWLRDLFGARREEAERRPTTPSPLATPEERARRQRYDAYAEEVAALSVEAARQRAEAILADGRYWRCTASHHAEVPRIRELSRSLGELFLRYAVIEDVSSEARLSREDIAPHNGGVGDVLTFGTEAAPDRQVYLRIGRDPDGNPLVVRAHEETVYVVHRPLVSGAKAWSTRYASVYHWILMRHFFQTERPAA